MLHILHTTPDTAAGANNYCRESSETLQCSKIDLVGSYILIKYSLILFDENISSKQITDTDKGISEALWRHLFFLSVVWSFFYWQISTVKPLHKLPT